MKRPFSLYILLALHFFLGINGFAGGLLLLLAPDGSLLGLQAGWLAHSPFRNYFIPGMLLLLFNGIFPLFVFTGLIRRPRWAFADVLNIYRDRHWAWTYSLFAGIISIAWITVQQVMTNYFWIQPVIIATGLLIIICTMMPRVMKAYSEK